MTWWSLVIPTNTPLLFVYPITSSLFLGQVVVTASFPTLISLCCWREVHCLTDVLESLSVCLCSIL